MKLFNEINNLIESADLNRVLDKLVSKFEKELVKDIQRSIIKMAEGSIQIIKKENMTRTVPLVTAWNRRNPYNQISTQFLDLMGDIPNSGMINPDKVKLKDNAEELALKSAQKAADKIISDFKAKVLSKIDKVTSRSGMADDVKIESVSTSGGAFEAVLEFKWKSGAQFDFRTSVVHAISQNGKWFARYPGTFHNVVLKDGTKLKKPSEAKMTKEFEA